MSKETLQHLNTNVLIGFTEKRGHAWHYREDLQGDEPNHYPGAIPVEDIQRRLFYWQAMSRPSLTTLPCDADDPEMVGIDDEGVPYKLLWIAGEQRIIRPDTEAVLSPAFKDGYLMHQYGEWLLTNTDTILHGEVAVSSAGLLKGGAVAWVEFSVPEAFQSPVGVEFRSNLLAATSFDASLATVFAMTKTDTVCDNTMAGALNEKGRKTRRKHTRYSHLNAQGVRDSLELIYTSADDYIEQLKMLDSVKVSPTQFSKFVDLHVLTDSSGKVREWKDLKGRSLTMATNKRDALMRLYQHDQRVEPWAGTALGVVKAVNTYVHHEGIVRGAERAERNMLNTVTGQFDKLDQQTFDMLQGVLV